LFVIAVCHENETNLLQKQIEEIKKYAMPCRLTHTSTTLFVNQKRVMRKYNPLLQKNHTIFLIIKGGSNYRIVASGNITTICVHQTCKKGIYQSNN